MFKKIEFVITGICGKVFCNFFYRISNFWKEQVRASRYYSALLKFRCIPLSMLREKLFQTFHVGARVFHMLLRGGSTSSLSHFFELYGAASVAPMWFSIVLSLLLRRGSTSSPSHFLELYGAASVSPMLFSIVLSLLLRLFNRVEPPLKARLNTQQNRMGATEAAP